MKIRARTVAPSATLALRGAAAAISLCLLAAAAPAVSARMAAQEANAYWRAKAETFVDAFALDPAGEAGEQLLQDPANDRLWRLARGFGVAADLDSFARDRDAIGVYQTFAAAHFDQAQRQAQELRCLAETIYYEARSESRAGQAAVAEVVLNRVRHSAYPNSICEVVYEGVVDGRRSGCQFTFACDGSLRRPPRGRPWENAEKLAAHAMLGFEGGQRTIGSSATHYHTTAVQPVWSGNLIRIGQVGSHIFYRFRGRNDPAPIVPTTPVAAPASDLPLSTIVTPASAPAGGDTPV